MVLLTIADVMRLYEVGRPTATKWLTSKGCPTLPRIKGGKYLVDKEAFEVWLKNGGKR